MKSLPSVAIFLLAYVVLLGIVISPASFGIAQSAMAVTIEE